MIRLYLDEDVPEAVAMALRLRGYDVLTAREVDRKGLSDLAQLKFASSEERVLLTHNIADFTRLHRELMTKGQHHDGIIVSKQLPIGVIVKALLRLLSAFTPDRTADRVLWLSDWTS